MSATVEGRRLTEAHRLAQSRLGAQTVQALRVLWRLLDPEDLDGSFDRWVTAVLPVLNRQHTSSATLAANYMRVFRAVELGSVARYVPVLAAFSSEQAATSLLVTGPVSVKKAMTRGVPVARAMATAEASSSGAGLRVALDGGRGTITESIATDREALGWARSTSGSPCAFCAMLASRGFVYKTQRTAGFQPHDSCNCQPEPTYREDAMLPPGSERYAELWKQAQREAAESGELRRGTENDALNAFRRHLNAGLFLPSRDGMASHT
jgi:hypothetical protein